jgi:di/tricarboxylate transporter
MSFEAGYVLALVIVALVLFAIDAMRVDVIALILLLALVVPGVLTAERALTGFGSDTLLTLASLFVLTEGVQRTGLVERTGLRLAGFGGANPRGFMRLLIVAATAISSFLSNTVTAAVLLPLAIGGARRTRTPASKILMPLAFATILAGGISLISTSTNLVVSGALPSFGLEPLGFFELAPVGLSMVGFGVLYLWFVAPRLIPDRGGDLVAEDVRRRFAAEIVLTPTSKMIGQTLASLHLQDALEIAIIGIRRGSRRLLSPGSTQLLQPGDELLIEGDAAQILAVKDYEGIDIKTDAREKQKAHADEQAEKANPKPKPKEGEAVAAVETAGEIRMVEAMVLPLSGMIGRTLRELRFQQRTGLSALGLHSANEARNVGKLSRWRFEAGDVVLLQGDVEDIDRVADEQGLLLLEDRSSHHPRSKKAPLAAAIFAGAVVLAATGVLALPIAFLIGALALVLTGCILADEAYAAIDWRILVLIGCMLAFGAAMQESGAASWLAGAVLKYVSPYGPHAVLAAFAILTAMLTQPMSNQAAALIVLPLAMPAAQELGLNPRAFAAAITLAASCSFIAPLEPASLLVYGPGRYRFRDYFRLGLPLTVLTFALNMFMIPRIWPLEAPARRVASSVEIHQEAPAAVAADDRSIATRSQSSRRRP